MAAMTWLIVFLAFNGAECLLSRVHTKRARYRLNSLADFEERARSVPASALESLQRVVISIEQRTNELRAESIAQHDVTEKLFSSLDYLQTHDAAPVVVTLLACTGALSLLSQRGDKAASDDQPYTSDGRYNAADAASYFASKPGVVFRRSVELAALSLGFALGLLADKVTGDSESKAEARASQLTTLLTQARSA